jgi:uncharacterized peroxidase-related enzyme
LAFHDEVLRGESDLSIAERELIAAFVSAENDCGFCTNAHRVYSAEFGIELELFDALVEDLESAPIDEKLRELLRFVRKLTQTPFKVYGVDTTRLLKLGWTEAAIHDAILVTGLFNLMNRIIFGHGIESHEEAYALKLSAARERQKSQPSDPNATELGSTPYQAFGQRLRQEE